MKSLLLFSGLFLSLQVFSLQAFALFNPEQAIHEAVSEPLEFIGSYIPNYSISGKYPNCVFRNSKVYILSSYCVKGDVGAASLRIHSVKPELGYMEIYAEGTVSKDVSEMTRQDYFDGLWYIASNPGDDNFDFAMPVSKYQNYDELQVTKPFLGCDVGNSSQGYPHGAICSKGFEVEGATWADAAVQYRNQPNNEWYALLKTIKEKVKAMP